MKVVIDIRKVRVRGSERIMLDITDPITLRTVSLQPLPMDSSFDNLQFVLMDMLERERDSSAHPVIKVDGEVVTALIPKLKTIIPQAGVEPALD